MYDDNGFFRVGDLLASWDKSFICMILTIGTNRANARVLVLRDDGENFKPLDREFMYVGGLRMMCRVEELAPPENGDIVAV